MLRSGSGVAVWPVQDGGGDPLRSKRSRGTARAQLVFILLCVEFEVEVPWLALFQISYDVTLGWISLLCSIQISCLAV